MDYVLLIAGLVLLLFSGDFLVRGSVSLASHFKVSKFVIGAVIVSIGTSAPELVVSLDATIMGHPDIAMGNVVGSNIANIVLILGLTALIIPVSVKGKGVAFDWSVMMFASILLLIFGLNYKLQFIEGLVFILLLIAFVYWSLHKSRKEQKENHRQVLEPRYGLIVSLILVAFSTVGLVFGADFLVKGSVSIARNFGVSERVISISFIALGTSLPELATSIAAAMRKELDIFIGNIIGSNIFNILGILGVTALCKTIDINTKIIQFDILWMLGISILLFLFILPLRRGTITRWKGLVFLTIYIVYIALLVKTRFV